MSQHGLVQNLARRFASWQFQARGTHRVLRELVEKGELVTDVTEEMPGTVIVRLPLALWRAACDEAAAPPPEPLP